MKNNPIDTKLIVSYLKESNLSIVRFCELCGIGVGTYKRIMSKGNCKIDAIFKIARVINIHICQMFIK